MKSEDIYRLREATDMPLMECKRALETTQGDFAKAVDLLSMPTHIREAMITEQRMRVIVREELARAGLVVQRPYGD